MEGSPEFKILEDKWTAISVDNKRCLILFFGFPKTWNSSLTAQKTQTDEFPGMVNVFSPSNC